MNNSPPVRKFKLRGVEVAVWAKHDEEKGTRFSLTAQKSYWDKTREEYVQTVSFFPEEAALLSILVQEAIGWIAEQKTEKTTAAPAPGGRVWSGDDNAEKAF